jgi:hypothetical protein
MHLFPNSQQNSTSSMQLAANWNVGSAWFPFQDLFSEWDSYYLVLDWNCTLLLREVFHSSLIGNQDMVFFEVRRLGIRLSVKQCFSFSGFMIYNL